MSDLKAQELLILNPLLFSDLGKYIWINNSFEEHREAQRLFDYLLKKNIYINGFATDHNSMVGLEMYHKKIYDINTLSNNESVVFFDSWFGCSDIDVSERGRAARVLNPNLGLNFEKENIVIWGSGITGERVYKILKTYGIQASCFVDSNAKLEGNDKCGLSIYAPDSVDKFIENPIIIEALEKWEELDESIREKYKKRFYFCLKSNEIWKGILCQNGKYLFSMSKFGMFHYFSGKKVYIYGIGDIEKEFVKYLQLLDFDFSGFLIDESNKETDKKTEDMDVRYVEEILYENNFYIWLCDIKKVRKLDELGLKFFKDYFLNGYGRDITISRKNLLDVNLAHNYLADSNYPGIMVYGEEKETDFKIAVLGGSTTDGAMYPIKSWTEYLYEDLKDITIYNGGVCGYTSGQELLKLIRDILPLKPDMVIVYDGNELDSNEKYPFTSLYLKEIFDFAKAHIEDDDDNYNYIKDNNEPVCMGIALQNNRFDNWLNNMRTMYAIANERGILFYGFCQPMLSSKEGKTEAEKNILLSMISTQIDYYMKESFRKNINELSEKPEYLYDLSDIFDGESGIYRDICHVWEKGNFLIAKAVKKVILPVLEERRIKT